MRCLGVLLVIPTLVIGISAKAEDDVWHISSNGLVNIRAYDSEKNKTLLTPQKHKSSTLSVTAVAALEAWKGPLTLSVQLRPNAIFANGDRETKFDVDEIYAEYAFTPESFLYGGRRNIVYGHSYGVNPLDVFLNPLSLDRSKNITRRRREIIGQDMIGFETLISDRFALNGYWAPSEGTLNEGNPQRALLAGTLIALEQNADFTFILIKDDRSGAGLSISQSLGQATVVYGDLVARRGRDRIGVGNDDGNRLFMQLSIGAGYTRKSATTFNLEYHYDANGYTTNEWNEVTKLIPKVDPPLNLLLNHFTLRRHYGFLRMYQPRLFDFDFVTETTVFHNLLDHSGIFGVRFEHKIGADLLLGIQGRYSYGTFPDEFVLRGGRASGSFYVTTRF